MNKIIYKYLFFLVVLIGSLYIVLGVELRNWDWIVIGTFLLNFIIIIHSILKDNIRMGYSINQMFWLFMLVFMGVAPLIQFLAKRYPWWNTEIITNDIVTICNLMILFFCSIYIIARKYYQQKVIRSKLEYYKSIKNPRLILRIGFWMATLCSMYIVFKTGFFNLFSRATNTTDVDGSLGMIIENTFRAFPVIVFSMQLIYKKKHGRYLSKIETVITLMLLIFVNFPTGLPRFKVAATYLGILIILKGEFENKNIFKYMILGGLLFVFPLINIFRYNTFSDLVSLNIIWPNPTLDFLEGDFDSYSMFARCLLYVSENGIAWGTQLLGALLFFIPRSIWPNKPIGSGWLIAEAQGWQFGNVSFPYIAEAAINFGGMGIVLFSIIIARFITVLDYRYDKCLEMGEKQIDILLVIYPFIIGLMFFILRGDLMSSLAFSIGFILPVLILYIIDSFIEVIKQ